LAATAAAVSWQPIDGRPSQRRISQRPQQSEGRDKSGLFLVFREEGAAGEETDRKALRRRAHAVRFAKQRRPRRSAAVGKHQIREKMNDGRSREIFTGSAEYGTAIYGASIQGNAQQQRRLATGIIRDNIQKNLHGICVQLAIFGQGRNNICAIRVSMY